MIKKLKICIILLLSFVFIQPCFAKDTYFKQFIFDNSNAITNNTKEYLSILLYDIAKRTDTYILLITFKTSPSLNFQDIEDKILNDTRLDTITDGKWILVIINSSETTLRISRGNKMRRILPLTMIRGIYFENVITRLIGNINYNTYKSRYIEGLTLTLIEAVADANNIKYNSFTPTTNVVKFIRRNNSLPAVVILIIGMMPFSFRRRRRRSSWYY